MKKLHLLLKDNSGATSIEYAFIALFISMVIIVAVTYIGESTSESFQEAADGIRQ